MLMLEIYLPIIMNRIHHNYFNEINYCSKSSKKKKNWYHILIQLR